MLFKRLGYLFILKQNTWIHPSNVLIHRAVQGYTRFTQTEVSRFTGIIDYIRIIDEKLHPRRWILMPCSMEREPRGHKAIQSVRMAS